MSANIRSQGIASVPVSAQETSHGAWLTEIARGLNLLLPMTSGTVELGPVPATFNKGISVVQTPAGSSVDPISFNHFVLTDTASITNDQFGVGLNIDYVAQGIGNR